MRLFIRNRWALAAVLLVAGSGLLAWSWLARSDGWLSGALVNIGTTLLLFAPLLLVGRYIEGRLENVQASQVQIAKQQEVAAVSIATLAEEISQTQAELRTTREQLNEAVAGRLAATRVKDRQTFVEVEEAPSHDALFAALIRAAELHLTTALGCRVPVHNTDLFLWFVRPTTHDRFQDEPDPDEDLYLRLERIDGEEVAQLTWSKAETAEDFLVALSEAVVRTGEYPGDGSFEAGSVLSDLRELLELTYDSATGGRADHLSGVIQYCPPQWVITERGLVSVGHPAGYSIPASRIEEPFWSKHMAGKSWLDEDSFDEAFEVGSALYRARQLAAQMLRNDEDMPF